MGGGRSFFIPETEKDPESGHGRRKDGVNLIDAWSNDKSQRNVPHAFVWNRTEFLSLSSPQYLLGKVSPVQKENFFPKDMLHTHRSVREEPLGISFKK